MEETYMWEWVRSSRVNIFLPAKPSLKLNFFQIAIAHHGHFKLKSSSTKYCVFMRNVIMQIIGWLFTTNVPIVCKCIQSQSILPRLSTNVLLDSHKKTRSFSHCPGFQNRTYHYPLNKRMRAQIKLFHILLSALCKLPIVQRSWLWGMSPSWQLSCTSKNSLQQPNTPLLIRPRFPTQLDMYH